MTQWKSTIHIGDVFHNDDLSLIQKRDAIVSRIKVTNWYKAKVDVQDEVESLSDVEDEDEFDYIWGNIYNLADRDRIWIETILSQPRKVECR